MSREDNIYTFDDKDDNDIETQVMKSMQQLTEDEISDARSYIDINNIENSMKDGNLFDEDDGKTRMIPTVDPASLDGGTVVLPSRGEIDRKLEERRSVQERDTYAARSSTNINASGSARNSTNANNSGTVRSNTHVNGSDNLRNNNNINNVNTVKTVSRANAESHNNTARSSNPANRSNNSSHNDGKNTTKDQNTVRSKNNKTGMKNKKLTITLIVAAVVAIIAIVVLIVVLINKNSSNKTQASYEYNYETGMSDYNAGKYEEAITYLEKAAACSEGVRNADLKYTLFKCYEKAGRTDDCISILKDIISFNKDYYSAALSLAEIYKNNGNSDGLNSLIEQYSKINSSLLSAYKVATPTIDKEAGEYDNDITITVTCDNKVYYTVDGKDPDSNSLLYTEPITLTSGTTELKLVAYDSSGVKSDIVTASYKISYAKLSAPDVSPASGSYSAGSTVTINNIPSNAKAYYTTDGTTPSSSSTLYTGEFEMPTGNNVISVIIIDEHKQESSITRRNYIIEEIVNISYNDAELLLASKLKTAGIVNSNVTVKYVFQNKLTVSGVIMYIVRVEITDKTGNTTTSYYGVDMTGSKFYKVTYSSDTYTAEAM